MDNDFLLLLQAKLEEASLKGIKGNLDQLKKEFEELKIKPVLDEQALSDLSVKINKLFTDNKITISNININSDQAVKNAQQSGKQIGDAVNKGVENSVKKVTNALKSFSELKIGTGNINAVFNENGLLDVEKSLDRIKEKYSEFGQVKITDKLFDSEGNLQQFRVNIQQLNGDLKESRSFMMALASSGKSFGFPEDIIKGSENYVHHLNDAKKATNEVLTEEEKLANIMADVREKTEQTRQAEEKRQQIAQSNAINKSLEQEYLQRQKISEQLSSKANKIQLSVGDGTYESKVEFLIAKTQQWTDKNGEARISTNELSKAFEQLTTASNNYANSPTETHQKALIASEKELDKQIKTVTNSVRSMNAELAKDSKVSSLHNQLADFMSKNSKTVKYFGNDLRDIFNHTEQGAKLTNQELTVLKQRFIDIQNTARDTGKLGKTWFQTLREGMSSFSYWTSSTFLVMKAIQSVKGGLGTVKALDTALVDLKKTTTMTNSELEQFYYDSNKVAKQMGVTTEEILKQAAAWSRLGYSSAEQATKMAQLSSQFASISPGMSTDEAQEGLVSIIKAWGLDVDEVEREVMDNINHLGNRFAESNIDLVNGMKRSAAALAATGTTYQDAFALFTGAQEVVQNAEVTGRALRSISMRMHGYSESSEDGLMEVDEELKNITGDLIDLTKTAEHSQGVSIFKEGSSTEFKSLVEYFGEINKIWDEMSQVQQNAFLDKAFGKNQANCMCLCVQKCA